MYTVNQIRSKFLEFFKSKGHEVVPSSPLVPHNDPTLMFTNAGMVPFKDVFTQNETRPYVRATSSQKCVRAGGKHNDLDNVGYTARHHTFFEMLGNFSFGDYFKEGAINHAWEFLTQVIGLPPEKLLVTVYHTDDEAFNIWKKTTGFPDEKIIRIPTNDNFWAMGDTGPCGPCSEIFYDHGPKIAGGPPGSPDADGDRFIEIWNLVFMQYEMLPSGERIDLPAPSIDTGMGLERLATILQGKHDNYDIDLFQSLIRTSQELTGNTDPAHAASHRVLADHLRSTSFLLADGVMPSNEGRGYVLRRIMRRAMRHARQLGATKPVMYKMVPTLVREMGEAYPELVRAQALITEIIKLEEERFGETLDRGLKLLDDEVRKLCSGEVEVEVAAQAVFPSDPNQSPVRQITLSDISKPSKEANILSGDVAFKLYDTYGFPYDLTVDILRGRGLKVDEAGFNAAMAEQKARARAAWKGSGEQATSEIWFEIREEFGATEFLGYEAEEAQAKVVAIVADGKRVQEISAGAEGSILLNQTPFYGESGGQEGDRGEISGDNGLQATVNNTAKMLGALHVHQVKIDKGQVRVGDVVTASVDGQRRKAIRANHSATHILHAVLRQVLGEHVTQKGSLVAEERLRFDIAHPKGLTAEELVAVETKVNDIIRGNTDVGTCVMAPEEAIKAGAMALFGEKYGDEVRVVRMGDADYSVELCGGTHVRRTGDIGLFKITGESAIAAGVRRIEALTGAAALSYIGETEKNLATIAGLLKVSPAQVAARVEALVEERRKLEKELANAKKQAAMGGSGGGDVEKEDIGGVAFIGKNFGDIPPKDLRDLATSLQQKIGSGVVVAGSSFEGKGSIIVTVSDDLTGRISAVDLVRASADILGAKGGGGKPNFAQTGGTNGDKVDEAIAKVKSAVA